MGGILTGKHLCCTAHAPLPLAPCPLPETHCMHACTHPHTAQPAPGLRLSPPRHRPIISFIPCIPPPPPPPPSRQTSSMNLSVHGLLRSLWQPVMPWSQHTQGGPGTTTTTIQRRHASQSPQSCAADAGPPTPAPAPPPLAALPSDLVSLVTSRGGGVSGIMVSVNHRHRGVRPTAGTLQGNSSTCLPA